MEAQELPEDAMSPGDFVYDRTLYLASGGKIRVRAEATIMLLNERDRRMVFGLIGMMTTYASDVGEDGFEPV